MRFKIINRRGFLVGAAFLIAVTAMSDDVFAKAKKKKITGPVTQATALVGGTVIDGRGGAPLVNGTVLFRDGKILAVGASAKIKLPKNTRVIRIDGKTVLPGLIDAHVHITGSGGGQVDKHEFLPVATVNNLRSYLKFGVTAVFDSGTNPLLEARSQAIRSGRMLGPKLFGVKYVLGAPGSRPFGMLANSSLRALLSPVYLEIASIEAANKAIARVAADQTSGVKIFNARVEFSGALPNASHKPRLTGEVLGALIEAAHGKKLKVLMHVTHPSEAREAILAGADALVHSITMPEADVESIFRIMAERNVAYVPTLARIEAVYAPKRSAAGIQNMRGKIWDVILDSLLSPRSAAINKSPKAMEEARRKFKIASANLGHAMQAGVRIVMGTDSGFAGMPHGATVSREMLLMAAAGMTPMQVIEAATRNAADLLGEGKRLGTIEKGKIADLLVLNASPLRDMSNIRAVASVVRGGYVIDPRGIPFEDAPR